MASHQADAGSRPVCITCIVASKSASSQFIQFMQMSRKMAATICLRPVTLTFDLKSVWESHVTWGTPVQSLVFLRLLVFELEPMYATSDRQTDGR